MTRPTDIDTALRATLHHAGQVWDAQSALQDAYRVDTGEPAPDLGTWDQLTELQRSLFLVMTPGAFMEIARAMHILTKENRS